MVAWSWMDGFKLHDTANMSIGLDEHWIGEQALDDGYVLGLREMIISEELQALWSTSCDCWSDVDSSGA